MTSPSRNLETGPVHEFAVPPVPRSLRTLHNSFTDLLPGVTKWRSAGLNMSDLPDPVAAGGLDEDVITAWAEAMTAHQEWSGDIYGERGAVRSYQNDVDIAAGDAPGRLLLRVRPRLVNSDRIPQFHAVEVFEDGRIEVRQVDDPRSFQSDEGGDVHDQQDPPSFASLAQKNAVQAFRKLHLLRCRASDPEQHSRPATIELISVNGAPHLMIDERHLAKGAGSPTESCYAWSMDQLRTIHKMEDVRSRQARATMVHDINMISVSKIENVPVDEQSGGHDFRNNAPGVAHRRVLNRIEANTLQEQVSASELAVDDREERDRACHVFRGAMLAAGGAKLPGSNGALVLDSAEMDMPLNHMVCERPDMLVAVREAPSKDDEALWVIRPYVIAPNGDVGRSVAYSVRQREFVDSDEGLRRICADAALRAGLHGRPEEEATESQDRSVSALWRILDMADEQLKRLRNQTGMQARKHNIRVPDSRPVVVLDTLQPCLLEVAHVRGRGANGVVDNGTEVKTHILGADGGTAEVDEIQAPEYISHAQFPDSSRADITLHAVDIGSVGAALLRCRTRVRDVAEMVRDVADMTEDLSAEAAVDFAEGP